MPFMAVNFTATIYSISDSDDSLSEQRLLNLLTVTHGDDFLNSGNIIKQRKWVGPRHEALRRKQGRFQDRYAIRR